jgi:hypothetical protein
MRMTRRVSCVCTITDAHIVKPRDSPRRRRELAARPCRDSARRRRPGRKRAGRPRIWRGAAPRRGRRGRGSPRARRGPAFLGCPALHAEATTVHVLDQALTHSTLYRARGITRPIGGYTYRCCCTGAGPSPPCGSGCGSPPALRSSRAPGCSARRAAQR